ncbi:MAG TPA: gamma-glutamyltransferase [Steroidobacteraceae bacterium]|nr:gamma-glutamyltransferase [Steroidobacteraceae bacterium]
MVAAANPAAADAGVEILRKGGNAIDAAVAVQAMLGLVEPQSSGVGGGSFLLYYDAATGVVSAITGRETAPAAAKPDMFLDAQGKPLPFFQAVRSGRSTGVPGTYALLGAAHARLGSLPWKELFGPAIEAARKGFKVSDRLAGYLSPSFPLAPTPEVRALFARPDGSPLQQGDTFKNPAYAQTLERLARQGTRALYSGEIAAQIVKRVHEDPLPGTMTVQDLAAYRAQWSKPLCGPFRQYSVCVPPPPSSGVSLLQLLGMLDHTDIASRGPEDPKAWFELAEGSRLMYADRDRYIGDPNFVHVPVLALLDPDYVRGRAELIGDRAGPVPQPGRLPGVVAGRDATVESAGTSHFVVMDHAGNVVSMTTTVESVFGSGRTVGGFVLNNELTDFSFRPVDDSGHPAANAVAGRKRPRSSMSPIIVLDHDGRFVAALGSPGGSSILEYNAKTVLGILAWGMSMQAAIDLPNIIAHGNDFSGEASKFSPAVREGLRARGIDLMAGRAENSGLHGIMRKPDGTFEGGADPRRDGVVRVLP